ncbi:MAG: hypothetical protein IJ776_01545, partial [Paludibacteraceae bacterium]|nr:hypothetical protein [Paludibacteraceae bacterium]
MKKLIMANAAVCICCLISTSIHAGDGNICSNAIKVDTAYNASLPKGEHWFTAETPALPLFLYWYPDDESARAPQIAVDFTCDYDENGKGIYSDSVIARMIGLADKHNLSFPMNSEMTRYTDTEGEIYYMSAFNEDYRDMLFQEGVTYSIPAYVRLKTFGQGNVRISSGSTWAQCMDYVNTLGMNVELLYEPEDSTNIYIWPLGEWSQLQYRITWEGEGKADFYAGKNCLISNTSLINKHYILPDNAILMNPERTDEWINDIYQTSLYVRLYANKSGVLKINTYDARPYVYEYIVMDIPAVINQEDSTITAVLPYGTNAKTRLNAIKAAQVKYVAFSGETVVYDRYGNTLTLGEMKYKLNIEPSKDSGAAGKSTDATLKSITIDGDSLENFLTGTLYYEEVEVDTDMPVISAEKNHEKATISISQPSGVPGIATITVTAEAGNTQTYKLSIIKRRSRNTELLSIIVDEEPLANFQSDIHQYRMYALSIPAITAVAADSKSTIVIDQAKGVPGFAQIFVTAEAGNVDTYTINFSIDPAMLKCSEEAVEMKLNSPITLPDNGDLVLHLPLGKPSPYGVDSANWAGQRIALSWSGAEDLRVYFGTTCLFDPAQPDKTLIDSADIT